MTQDAISPDELKRLHALIEEHQTNQRYHLAYGASIAEQVASLIRRYEAEATRALAGVKSFRDDTRAWLQAMVIVASTVGNAGTHREKDARLRGMIEILESVINKLTECEFDFDSSYYRWPNLYRSDYPVRRYMERAETAEATAQSATAKAATWSRSARLLTSARTKLAPEYQAAFDDALKLATAEMEADEKENTARFDDASDVSF